jgi:hypothetical protein
MTDTNDTDYYDKLIALYEKQDTNGKIKDPDSHVKHLTRLKNRRAGIPDWECYYEVDSPLFSSLPFEMKWQLRENNHHDGLSLKVKETIAADFGLSGLDMASILGPKTTSSYSDWASVQAWYDQHATIDHKAVAATVDRIVAEHIASLPFITRLKIQWGVRHPYEGQHVHPALCKTLRIARKVRSTLRSPWETLGLPAWETLKASLTKALDILRPKA